MHRLVDRRSDSVRTVILVDIVTADEGSDATCTIFLVRHAESLVNAGLVRPQDVGPDGSPLSDLGREQASALADRLGTIAFAAFYSSDLARARETAEIASGGAAVTTSSDLRERFLTEDGELELRADVVGRMRGTLERIAAVHPGARVLAVGHGYAMRAYLVSIGFATREQLPAGAIESTGYVTLRIGPHGHRVVSSDGVTAG